MQMKLARILSRKGSGKPADNARKLPLPQPADPQSNGASASVRSIKVLTYNIHHGRGTDGKYSLERIASVIAAQDPDIVALQEVEKFRTRTAHDDQPEHLAELLGMKHVFAPIRTHCLRDSHT